MAKRKNLKTLFHIDPQKAQVEYIRRKEADTSILFPLQIGSWPAFMETTSQIQERLACVEELNTRLQELEKSLPSRKELQKQLLLDEIEKSNQIEGIHPSRQQLIQLWDSPEKTNLPLAGMVQQYRQLLQPEKSENLLNPAQIWALYDGLVAADIPQEDLPDGILFRKDGVSVVGGCPTATHHGMTGEAALTETLEKGLNFLYRAPAPWLIKTAFFHFLIGYVHPFYDGNGRLARYLSALLLAKELPLDGILQLSTQIRLHRSQYYRAFQEAENPLNQGELTEFIQFFLDMTEKSIQAVLHLYQESTLPAVSLA